MIMWPNFCSSGSYVFVTVICNQTESFWSNSSNTSRTTFSDFQTPRGVEIVRRSRAFLTNLEVFGNRGKSNSTYEYLNVLLKLSRICRENRGEIWPSFCNFFLRFPNIVRYNVIKVVPTSWSNDQVTLQFWIIKQPLLINGDVDMQYGDFPNMPFWLLLVHSGSTECTCAKNRISTRNYKHYC